MVPWNLHCMHLIVKTDLSNEISAILMVIVDRDKICMELAVASVVVAVYHLAAATSVNENQFDKLSLKLFW